MNIEISELSKFVVKYTEDDRSTLNSTGLLGDCFRELLANQPDQEEILIHLHNDVIESMKIDIAKGKE